MSTTNGILHKDTDLILQVIGHMIETFREDSQFFENIAVIVDDLFNDYIRREGQIQPLFAQYCAGKNGSTCNGLSQWGSVT